MEVLSLDALQVLNGTESSVLSLDGILFESTDGGVHTSSVHSVTDGTGIGEVWELHTFFNVSLENGEGIDGDIVLKVSSHDLSNLCKFVRLVVREVNVVTNTGGETGDVGEEGVHAIFVSGNSDDKIVLVVLHDVEKNFDGFLSVITVVGSIVEVVSLIDKKKTSHGLLDHLLSLGSSVSDILSYKIVTGGKDDVSTARVSHLCQNLSHPDSDGGLSGSGSSSETHVEGRNSGFETKLSTHLIENKKGSNFLNTLLDSNKSNKVSVKLVKLVLNTLLEHKFIDYSFKQKIHKNLGELKFDEGSDYEVLIR